MKILDPTFLIDLQRERGRKITGLAHQYLSRNPNPIFNTSTISIIEYEEGFPDGELNTARQFLSVFPVLDITFVHSKNR